MIIDSAKLEHAAFALFQEFYKGELWALPDMGIYERWEQQHPGSPAPQVGLRLTEAAARTWKAERLDWRARARATLWGAGLFAVTDDATEHAMPQRIV
jgi:hypothetical protein